MIRIESLLKTLCPQGVEHKKLGEIGTSWYRGSGIRRDQISIKGNPCVRYGEIYTTYGIWFDSCVSNKDPHIISTKKYFGHGDILFAITGESVEEIGKSTAYTGHQQCLAGGDVVVMKHNQNPKFLSYALSTANAQSQKSKGKVKSKVVHSSIPALQGIKIPVPPLAVQEEIVRILDTFTNVVAELEAELEARSIQFEHYRDYLLFSSPSKVNAGSESVTLHDVAHYSRERINANKINGQSYVGVDNLLQNKQGKVDSVFVPEKGQLIQYQTNDVLIGNIRPYLKKIWHANNDGGTNGDVLCIRLNDAAKGKIRPRFLYQMLASEEFFTYAIKNSRGAKMPRGNKDLTMKFDFRLPPIAVQEEIVTILDRFETLVNDIKSGLPAEIAARRKQYEYYRDKLLTFKEKPA